MIKIIHEDKEQIILTVLDGMNWKGTKDQGPRSLEFQFLYKPLNDDLPKYLVSVGDKVIWQEEEKILFNGYIETLDYSTDDDTISVSCKDLMSRLMRSKFIGRMRGTLNQLANNICASFGLVNGINIDSSHIHNITSTGDLTYFDVLKTACTNESGLQQFNLYMDNTTLKLAKHEIQNTFEIGKNIRSSIFKFDISNIVTKVLVLDNNGNLIKPVQNDELIAKFGLFQEIYNFNKDCKDNFAEARKLIKGPLKESSIMCDNDNNCISGNFIKVIEPTSGSIGIFEIIDDTHIINSDSYMQLNIQLVE